MLPGPLGGRRGSFPDGFGALQNQRRRPKRAEDESIVGEQVDLEGVLPPAGLVRGCEREVPRRHGFACRGLSVDGILALWLSFPMYNTGGVAMRNVAKLLLKSVGVELRRYSPLSRACDMLIQKGENPTFLQIGANDGVMHDDVYPLVSKHQLTGVVVEPIPAYFETLRQIYIRQPRVKPVNMALHPSEPSMQLFMVDPKKATQTWHHGLPSFNRENVKNHYGVTDDMIVPVEVPCVSFNRLCAEHLGGRALDILVIDTEGFDGEILAMVDWTIHRPKVIQFERKHIPGPDFDQLRQKLRGMGYAISWDHTDCWATRPELVSPLSYFRAMISRQTSLRPPPGPALEPAAA